MAPRVLRRVFCMAATMVETSFSDCSCGILVDESYRCNFVDTLVAGIRRSISVSGGKGLNSHCATQTCSKSRVLRLVTRRRSVEGEIRRLEAFLRLSRREGVSAPCPYRLALDCSTKSSFLRLVEDM